MRSHANCVLWVRARKQIWEGLKCGYLYAVMRIKTKTENTAKNKNRNIEWFEHVFCWFQQTIMTHHLNIGNHHIESLSFVNKQSNDIRAIGYECDFNINLRRCTKNQINTNIQEWWTRSLDENLPTFMDTLTATIPTAESTFFFEIDWMDRGSCETRKS